ncbi:MAG: hypothetical protein AAF597_20865, partial [Bacteroidota bacterium]
SLLEGITVLRSAMMIGNTGNVQIEESGSTGFYVRGGITVVKGSLTVNNTNGTGFVRQSAESFAIGETGSLAINDSSNDGIFIYGDNPIDNAGTLSISGSGREAVDGGGTLANQATATFRVEGVIDADIQFAAGSRFEPGTSPGCVNFEDPADLGATTLAIEIEGTEACVDYDQVVFEMGVAGNNVTLELSGSYVPQLGDTFVIAREAFSGINNGFAGLRNGNTLVFNGVELEASYEANIDIAEDQIVLRVVSILPLDLLSFTGEARDKTNFLTWMTANEEDFGNFEVERSPDGRGPWSVLAQLDLQASGVHEYIDESPLSVAYYRLKMCET